jgi:hypothetical protein
LSETLDKPSRPSSGWQWPLLAGVLLLAQTLLAFHEIEHLGHPEEDDACSVCVLGAPLGAAIADPSAILVLDQCYRTWPIATADQPTLRTTFTPHSARAPPASGAT